MSVGGAVITPSIGILRRTPSRGKINVMNRNRLSAQFNNEKNYIGSPTSGIGVHFAVPENLSELLNAASKKDEKSTDSKIEDEIQGLLTHIRNARGEVLIAWLLEIQKNVSSLKPRMEYFVLALLKIGWADQTEKVVESYHEFLVNLVTAQGYYIKPVLNMLISYLAGFKNVQLCEENEQNKLRELELTVFANTHAAIKAILNVVPLDSQRALIQYIQECLPYILTPNTHIHTNYVKNILAIADYDIQLKNGGRLVILGVLIERLVQLDAHVDNNHSYIEETTESETNQSNGSTEFYSKKSPNAAAYLNLNAAMLIIFAYLDKNTSNNQDLSISQRIYKDFLKCFEMYIMPAMGTRHVQFLIFYIISCKPELADGFLKWLWIKFISPNTSSIMRQTSMAYLSGFISRARCVSKVNLMTWLQKICNWIHCYIDQSLNSSCVALNVHAHAPFYAACQAVFYMFVFRLEELKDSKLAMGKIEKLNFQKIIACHLNPLRFCAPGIARNFSAVSNYYQVAYCETILMKNQRLNLPIIGSARSMSGNSNSVTLELMHSFFPFDPYLLKNTKSYIELHFRQCEGSIFDEVEDSSSDDDWFEEIENGDEEPMIDIVETFDKELNEEHNPNMQQNVKRKRLASSSSSISKAKKQEFGYSLLPGFKQ